MNKNRSSGVDGARTDDKRELRRRFLSKRWFSTSTARKSRPRNEWGFARFARRRPGVAAWCLVAVVVGTQLWSSEARSPRRRWSPETHNERLLRRARRDVKGVLNFIGHGVQVKAVEVRHLAPWVVASYHTESQVVSVADGGCFSKVELLKTAAHECVHALFRQADLVHFDSSHWAYFLLVEETAAYVLGAHIAGRVWSIRGRDGEALTTRLVQRHRNDCDMSRPDSVFREIMDEQEAWGQHVVDADYEWSASVHIASPALVDEIDQICRITPDAWTAAHVISERYLQWDEDDEAASRVENDWVPRRRGVRDELEY